MGCEVIPWPKLGGPVELNLQYRLEGLVAIFRAIEAGELLAALPTCELAQEQHRTAVRLLSLVERELIAMVDELAPH